MVARLVLTLLALGFAPGMVHADSPKLADARLAIDHVRYDQAQELLVAALHDGGASPHEVAEIYELSASTAIVLRQPEAAEQYYRRWLALEPNATLPKDIAPKLRQPFVAAQAYMAAHGRLSVRATREAHAIQVVIASDPLAMAASAAIDGEAPVVFDADRRARVAARGAASHVAVLDEYGNHLVELDAPASSPEPVDAPHVTPPRPLLRRPLTWLAPGLVFTAIGAGFARAASRNDDTLNTLLADSANHFFGEIDAARSARDRDALIADGAFGAGLACGVVAAVMLLDSPHPAAIVAPRVRGDSVGVVISGAW